VSEFILEADDVGFSYSRKGPKVLNGMSMSIRQGVKTAILGANGAGKSTLFSILNALNKPSSGEVRYKGVPLTYKRKDIIRMRMEVSILFQNPNDMMFKPYVGADVAYGPENLGLPKDEVERRVDEALFAVGMTEFKKTPCMKLSYGQRKRVSFAGILAMDPSVIIMDEPTAGLDPQMAYEVMEIAEKLHRSGVTVIMSSHDTDLTYSWADEIHVMRKGTCVYSGDPETFYSDKEEVYLSGLLPPKTFIMNDGLSGSGGFEKIPYPRTQTQMSAKISDNSGRSMGTLHIVAVGTDDDINSIKTANGMDGMPSGIYGMSARRAQDSSKAAIDFMYNGPENCTMKCMAGMDSVLFCDPEMVDSARASADFINSSGFGKIDVHII